MTATLTPTIVQPGTGKDLHAFGNILTVMLGGDQTGNQLSIMSEVTPPGGGPPMHMHTERTKSSWLPRVASVTV